jgi:hypothetical protein
LPENRRELRFKSIAAAAFGTGVALYGLTELGEVYLYRGTDKGWQAVPMWSEWQGLPNVPDAAEG